MMLSTYRNRNKNANRRLRALMENPELRPAHTTYAGLRYTLFKIGQGKKTIKNARLLAYHLHSYILQSASSEKKRENFVKRARRKILYVHFFCCKVAEETNQYVLDHFMKEALVAYILLELNVIRDQGLIGNKLYEIALERRVRTLLVTIFTKYYFYLTGKFDKIQVYEMILNFLVSELPLNLPEFFNNILIKIKKVLPPKPTCSEMPYYTKRSSKSKDKSKDPFYAECEAQGMVIDLTQEKHNESVIDIDDEAFIPEFNREVWKQFKAMQSYCIKKLSTLKHPRTAITQTNLKANTVIYASDTEDEDDVAIIDDSRLRIYRPPPVTIDLTEDNDENHDINDISRGSIISHPLKEVEVGQMGEILCKVQSLVCQIQQITGTSEMLISMKDGNLEIDTRKRSENLKKIEWTKDNDNLRKSIENTFDAKRPINEKSPNLKEIEQNKFKTSEQNANKSSLINSKESPHNRLLESPKIISIDLSEDEPTETENATLHSEKSTNNCQTINDCSQNKQLSPLSTALITVANMTDSSKMTSIALSEDDLSNKTESCLKAHSNKITNVSKIIEDSSQNILPDIQKITTIDLSEVDPPSEIKSTVSLPSQNKVPAVIQSEKITDNLELQTSKQSNSTSVNTFDLEDDLLNEIEYIGSYKEVDEELLLEEDEKSNESDKKEPQNQDLNKPNVIEEIKENEDKVTENQDFEESTRENQSLVELEMTKQPTLENSKIIFEISLDLAEETQHDISQNNEEIISCLEEFKDNENKSQEALSSCTNLLVNSPEKVSAPESDSVEVVSQSEEVFTTEESKRPQNELSNQATELVEATNQIEKLSDVQETENDKEISLPQHHNLEDTNEGQIIENGTEQNHDQEPSDENSSLILENVNEIDETISEIVSSQPMQRLEDDSPIKFSEIRSKIADPKTKVHVEYTLEMDLEESQSKLEENLQCLLETTLEQSEEDSQPKTEKDSECLLEATIEESEGSQSKIEKNSECLLETTLEQSGEDSQPKTEKDLESLLETTLEELEEGSQRKIEKNSECLLETTLELSEEDSQSKTEKERILQQSEEDSQLKTEKKSECLLGTTLEQSIGDSQPKTEENSEYLLETTLEESEENSQPKTEKETTLQQSEEDSQLKTEKKSECLLETTLKESEEDLQPKTEKKSECLLETTLKESEEDSQPKTEKETTLQQSEEGSQLKTEKTSECLLETILKESEEDSHPKTEKNSECLLETTLKEPEEDSQTTIEKNSDCLLEKTLEQPEKVLDGSTLANSNTLVDLECTTEKFLEILLEKPFEDLQHGHLKSKENTEEVPLQKSIERSMELPEQDPQEISLFQQVESVVPLNEKLTTKFAEDFQHLLETVKEFIAKEKEASHETCTIKSVDKALIKSDPDPKSPAINILSNIILKSCTFPIQKQKTRRVKISKRQTFLEDNVSSDESTSRRSSLRRPREDQISSSVHITGESPQTIELFNKCLVTNKIEFKQDPLVEEVSSRSQQNSYETKTTQTQQQTSAISNVDAQEGWDNIEKTPEENLMVVDKSCFKKEEPKKPHRYSIEKLLSLDEDVLKPEQDKPVALFNVLIQDNMVPLNEHIASKDEALNLKKPEALKSPNEESPLASRRLTRRTSSFLSEDILKNLPQDKILTYYPDYPLYSQQSESAPLNLSNPKEDSSKNALNLTTDKINSEQIIDSTRNEIIISKEEILPAPIKAIEWQIATLPLKPISLNLQIDNSYHLESNIIEPAKVPTAYLQSPQNSTANNLLKLADVALQDMYGSTGHDSHSSQHDSPISSDSEGKLEIEERPESPVKTDIDFIPKSPIKKVKTPRKRTKTKAELKAVPTDISSYEVKVELKTFSGDISSDDDIPLAARLKRETTLNEEISHIKTLQLDVQSPVIVKRKRGRPRRNLETPTKSTEELKKKKKQKKIKKDLFSNTSNLRTRSQSTSEPEKVKKEIIKMSSKLRLRKSLIVSTKEACKSPKLSPEPTINDEKSKIDFPLLEQLPEASPKPLEAILATSPPFKKRFKFLEKKNPILEETIAKVAVEVQKHKQIDNLEPRKMETLTFEINPLFSEQSKIEAVNEETSCLMLDEMPVSQLKEAVVLPNDQANVSKEAVYPKEIQEDLVSSSVLVTAEPKAQQEKELILVPTEEPISATALTEVTSSPVDLIQVSQNELKEESQKRLLVELELFSKSKIETLQKRTSKSEKKTVLPASPSEVDTSENQIKEKAQTSQKSGASENLLTKSTQDKHDNSLAILTPTDVDNIEVQKEKSQTPQKRRASTRTFENLLKKTSTAPEEPIIIPQKDDILVNSTLTEVNITEIEKEKRQTPKKRRSSTRAYESLHKKSIEEPGLVERTKTILLSSDLDKKKIDKPQTPQKRRTSENLLTKSIQDKPDLVIPKKCDTLAAPTPTDVDNTDIQKDKSQTSQKRRDLSRGSESLPKKPSDEPLLSTLESLTDLRPTESDNTENQKTKSQTSQKRRASTRASESLVKKSTEEHGLVETTKAALISSDLDNKEIEKEKSQTPQKRQGSICPSDSLLKEPPTPSEETIPQSEHALTSTEVDVMEAQKETPQTLKKRRPSTRATESLLKKTDEPILVIPKKDETLAVPKSINVDNSGIQIKEKSKTTQKRRSSTRVSENLFKKSSDEAILVATSKDDTVGVNSGIELMEKPQIVQKRRGETRAESLSTLEERVLAKIPEKDDTSVSPSSTAFDNKVIREEKLQTPQKRRASTRTSENLLKKPSEETSIPKKDNILATSTSTEVNISEIEKQKSQTSRKRCSSTRASESLLKESEKIFDNSLLVPTKEVVLTETPQKQIDVPKIEESIQLTEPAPAELSPAELHSQKRSSKQIKDLPKMKVEKDLSSISSSAESPALIQLSKKAAASLHKPRRGRPPKRISRKYKFPAIVLSKSEQDKTVEIASKEDEKLSVTQVKIDEIVASTVPDTSLAIENVLQKLSITETSSDLIENKAKEVESKVRKLSDTETAAGSISEPNDILVAEKSNEFNDTLVAEKSTEESISEIKNKLEDTLLPEPKVPNSDDLNLVTEPEMIAKKSSDQSETVIELAENKHEVSLNNDSEAPKSIATETTVEVTKNNLIVESEEEIANSTEISVKMTENKSETVLATEVEENKSSLEETTIEEETKNKSENILVTECEEKSIVLDIKTTEVAENKPDASVSTNLEDKETSEISKNNVIPEIVHKESMAIVENKDPEIKINRKVDIVEQNKEKAQEEISLPNSDVAMSANEDIVKPVIESEKMLLDSNVTELWDFECENEIEVQSSEYENAYGLLCESIAKDEEHDSTIKHVEVTAKEEEKTKIELVADKKKVTSTPKLVESHSEIETKEKYKKRRREKKADEKDSKESKSRREKDKTKSSSKKSEESLMKEDLKQSKIVKKSHEDTVKEKGSEDTLKSKDTRKLVEESRSKSRENVLKISEKSKESKVKSSEDTSKIVKEHKVKNSETSKDKNRDKKNKDRIDPFDELLKSSKSDKERTKKNEHKSRKSIEKEIKIKPLNVDDKSKSSSEKIEKLSKPNKDEKSSQKREKSLEKEFKKRIKEEVTVDKRRRSLPKSPARDVKSSKNEKSSKQSPAREIRTSKSSTQSPARDVKISKNDKNSPAREPKRNRSEKSSTKSPAREMKGNKIEPRISEFKKVKNDTKDVKSIKHDKSSTQSPAREIKKSKIDTTSTESPAKEIKSSRNDGRKEKTKRSHEESKKDERSSRSKSRKEEDSIAKVSKKSEEGKSQQKAPKVEDSIAKVSKNSEEGKSQQKAPKVEDSIAKVSKHSEDDKSQQKTPKVKEKALKEKNYKLHATKTEEIKPHQKSSKYKDDRIPKEKDVKETATKTEQKILDGKKDNDIAAKTEANKLPQKTTKDEKVSDISTKPESTKLQSKISKENEETSTKLNKSSKSEKNKEACRSERRNSKQEKATIQEITKRNIVASPQEKISKISSEKKSEAESSKPNKDVKMPSKDNNAIIDLKSPVEQKFQISVTTDLTASTATTETPKQRTNVEERKLCIMLDNRLIDSLEPNNKKRKETDDNDDSVIETTPKKPKTNISKNQNKVTTIDQTSKKRKRNDSEVIKETKKLCVDDEKASKTEVLIETDKAKQQICEPLVTEIIASSNIETEFTDNIILPETLESYIEEPVGEQKPIGENANVEIINENIAGISDLEPNITESSQLQVDPNKVYSHILDNLKLVDQITENASMESQELPDNATVTDSYLEQRKVDMVPLDFFVNEEVHSASHNENPPEVAHGVELGHSEDDQIIEKNLEGSSLLCGNNTHTVDQQHFENFYDDIMINQFTDFLGITETVDTGLAFDSVVTTNSSSPTSSDYQLPFNTQFNSIYPGGSGDCLVSSANSPTISVNTEENPVGDHSYADIVETVENFHKSLQSSPIDAAISPQSSETSTIKSVIIDHDNVEMQYTQFDAMYETSPYESISVNSNNVQSDSIETEQSEEPTLGSDHTSRMDLLISGNSVETETTEINEIDETTVSFGNSSSDNAVILDDPLTEKPPLEVFCLQSGRKGDSQIKSLSINDVATGDILESPQEPSSKQVEPLTQQTRQEQELLARQEQLLKQEQISQEQLKQEQLRLEQLKQEEQLREEQLKQEQLRQEQLLQEQIRQEKLKEEQLKQEQLKQQEQLRRQEQLKQEQLKQEQLREEQLKREQLSQEQFRQEQIRQEKLREEQLKQEQLRQEQLRQVQLRQEQLKQQVQKVTLLPQKITSSSTPDKIGDIYSLKRTSTKTRVEAPRRKTNSALQKTVPSSTITSDSTSQAITVPSMSPRAHTSNLPILDNTPPISNNSFRSRKNKPSMPVLEQTSSGPFVKTTSTQAHKMCPESPIRQGTRSSTKNMQEALKLSKTETRVELPMDPFDQCKNQPIIQNQYFIEKQSGNRKRKDTKVSKEEQQELLAKQEQLKQEQLKQEKLRHLQLQKQEQLRQEQLKQEQLRKEQMKREKVRQEQELARQEQLVRQKLQEELKKQQEQLRKEQDQLLRQELIRQAQLSRQEIGRVSIGQDTHWPPAAAVASTSSYRAPSSTTKSKSDPYEHGGFEDARRQAYFANDARAAANRKTDPYTPDRVPKRSGQSSSRGNQPHSEIERLLLGVEPLNLTVQPSQPPPRDISIEFYNAMCERINEMGVTLFPAQISHSEPSESSLKEETTSGQSATKKVSSLEIQVEAGTQLSQLKQEWSGQSTAKKKEDPVDWRSKMLQFIPSDILRLPGAPSNT